jgi:hypothetical protein
MGGATHNAV